MMDRIFSFDTMWWLLMIIYIPACIGLIVIVLLQKGKGTGFAGAFGAGAGPGSDTVFGPRMSRSLPIRLTYAAATLFMVIAVVMSLIAGKVGKGVAPELIEDAADAPQAAASSALAGRGLGTNKADAARPEEAPAPVVLEEAPAVVEEPGAEAPVPEAPAAVEDAPAAVEVPAEETAPPAQAPVDEDAPAEEAPVSQ